MALLSEDIKKQIVQALMPMDAPVRLVVFSQAARGALELECTMCAETRHLAEEVAALSDKISVEVLDFVRDAEQVEKYGVDKIPATVVLQDGPQPKDFGIRLYGIPSGYEFSSFIHDILLASRGNPDLKPKTLDALGRLDRRVQIQVYVTPT